MVHVYGGGDLILACQYKTGHQLVRTFIGSSIRMRAFYHSLLDRTPQVYGTGNS